MAQFIKTTEGAVNLDLVVHFEPGNKVKDAVFSMVNGEIIKCRITEPLEIMRHPADLFECHSVAVDA